MSGMQIKMSLVAALHKNKFSKIFEILESPMYICCDAIFLQEVAAAMVHHLQEHPSIQSGFHILSPESLDGKRGSKQYNPTVEIALLC